MFAPSISAILHLIARSHEGNSTWHPYKLNIAVKSDSIKSVKHRYFHFHFLRKQFNSTCNRKNDRADKHEDHPIPCNFTDILSIGQRCIFVPRRETRGATAWASAMSNTHIMLGLLARSILRFLEQRRWMRCRLRKPRRKSVLPTKPFHFHFFLRERRDKRGYMRQSRHGQGQRRNLLEGDGLWKLYRYDLVERRWQLCVVQRGWILWPSWLCAITCERVW